MMMRNFGLITALALTLASPPTLASTAPDSAEGGVWENIVNTFSDIARNGHYDAYLSGYAYHSRKTYAAKRISALNEWAWGGGIGKSLRNERGNEESIYLTALRDSNRNYQWSAGYAYQWMFPIAKSGVEAGAGITATVIRRRDWYDGTPFPALLPMASLGSEKVKLSAVYVPRISSKKGKGDVVLVYLKLSM